MLPIPPDTPPGLRAEYEVVTDEMVNDYPEARALRTQFDVPTAVVVATPPGRLEGGIGGALVRLQLARQAQWALGAPDGMFVTAGHMGHAVHRDDPELVLRLIAHAVERGTPEPAAQ